MRILLVEDEQRLSNVIKKGLIEDGFAVDAAYDGEEGQYLAESEEYDLIILDFPYFKHFFIYDIAEFVGL